MQLFSLFEANPQLTELIVDICATAPALAQYLSRNSAVFDAVIGGGFFSDWPGVDSLRADLAQVLAEAPDYEAGLDEARRWHKEWHFRIGVHHLRGLTPATVAGREYADLAEATLAALWPAVCAHFAVRHGPPPGRGAVVVGMGSLGAARLNAASDLDLIVIYDAQGADASDGARPLATRQYFARLTQAMVTALTAPMPNGRLYEVDMRLRPSGRQGPVATSLAAFEDYQRNEAWTWEHLALTRARAIAGDGGLAAEIEAFRRALLRDKSAGQSVLADVAEMRGRIAEAKVPQGLWDAKIGAGRLQDIELLAQTGALLAGSPARELPDQIAAGVATGFLSAAEGAALQAASGLFWQVQATARLIGGGALAPDDLGEGGTRMALRETGHETIEDLAAALAEAAAAAGAIVDARLGGASADQGDA